MPQIHEYVDSRSLYIKARHEGRITTYQVTLEGEKLLRQHDLGDGDSSNVGDLVFLLSRGLIYTRQSGPGVLDDDYPVDLPPSRFQEPSSTPEPVESNEQSHDGFWWVFVGLAVLIMTLDSQCNSG